MRGCATGQEWLPDNKRIWFLAEHDGWMHLYTVDVTTGQRKQLTSGNSRSTTSMCLPMGERFTSGRRKHIRAKSISMR